MALTIVAFGFNLNVTFMSVLQYTAINTSVECFEISEKLECLTQVLQYIHAKSCAKFCNLA